MYLEMGAFDLNQPNVVGQLMTWGRSPINFFAGGNWAPSLFNPGSATLRGPKINGISESDQSMCGPGRRLSGARFRLHGQFRAQKIAL